MTKEELKKQLRDQIADLHHQITRIFLERKRLDLIDDWQKRDYLNKEEEKICHELKCRYGALAEVEALAKLEGSYKKIQEDSKGSKEEE